VANLINNEHKGSDRPDSKEGTTGQKEIPSETQIRGPAEAEKQEMVKTWRWGPLEGS